MSTISYPLQKRKFQNLVSEENNDSIFSSQETEKKMAIRHYEPKDMENVRFVCLDSAAKIKASKCDQNLLLNTFCNYYIEHEPQICFAATDESDNAILSLKTS